LAALVGPPSGGPPIAAVAIAALVPVAAALAALGLKMTLGRQSLAATSYRPDLAQEPPVDILAATAARLAEPPDQIDPMEEGLPS
jgi:hypothetical protein